MSDFDYYIHLQSPTMNPADLTAEARAVADRTWCCPGCNTPKPGIERLDAHLQNRRLQGPLNIVNGYGLALARWSFLLRLGEERVRRALHLGEVFRPDGTRWDDWVTFRGKHGLIVRGSGEHAGNRVCPECGRNCYFGMYPKYLYPQPPTDVEIFESHAWGLSLRPDIATEVGIGGRVGRIQGIEVLEWPGVSVKGKRGHLLVERLPVLAEPKDGLPPLEFRPASPSRPA